MISSRLYSCRVVFQDMSSDDAAVWASKDCPPAAGFVRQSVEWKRVDDTAIDVHFVDRRI